MCKIILSNGDWVILSWQPKHLIRFQYKWTQYSIATSIVKFWEIIWRLSQEERISRIININLISLMGPMMDEERCIATSRIVSGTHRNSSLAKRHGVKVQAH